MSTAEISSKYFKWLLDLPRVFGNIMEWAVHPISDLFPFSPMDILGTSLLTVLGIVLVAKAVHLIIA